MSYADKVFKTMCEDVLTSGTDTRGEKVRPRWEDGTPAYTIKKFGIINQYDLQKEFPALTIRKTALKSCMDEILWIYQKKSNNIKDLHSHIWDEWADKKGSIGKAYGYQVGKIFSHHKTTEEEKDKEGFKKIKKEYSSLYLHSLNGYTMMDQMDAVLYDLKNNPFSRRILISLWNTSELSEMNLYPCCWSVTFNVTNEKKEKLVLNMILNQRSNDILAANNWNTCQYAILLMMVSQSVNMIPGKLIHVISDAHIYDRHVDIIKELLQRKEHEAPKVSLNKEVKNFYDFTTDDLLVENYITEPQIKNIPIAI